MNIYQKMAAITADLNAVAKNLKVGEGKSSYKAVGEADVLAAVKPLEQKHGVYSFPVSRSIIDRDIITTRKSYNGQESETTKFFMRVETVYRFVNIDDPNDYIDIFTYGDGIDSGDKAPGKAMTYGDKYALLKAYKIITGDDPDQSISEDGKFSSKGTRPLSSYACVECGTSIEDYFDGKDTIPAAAMAKRSREKYGSILCVKCARKKK